VPVCVAIVVGISGPVGRSTGPLLQVLRAQPEIETHLVVSKAALLTIAHETPFDPEAVTSLADRGLRPGRHRGVHRLGLVPDRGHGHRPVLDEDAVGGGLELHGQPHGPRRGRLPEGAPEAGPRRSGDAPAPRAPAAHDGRSPRWGRWSSRRCRPSTPGPEPSRPSSTTPWGRCSTSIGVEANVMDRWSGLPAEVGVDRLEDPDRDRPTPEPTPQLVAHLVACAVRAHSLGRFHVLAAQLTSARVDLEPPGRLPPADPPGHGEVARDGPHTGLTCVFCVAKFGKAHWVDRLGLAPVSWTSAQPRPSDARRVGVSSVEIHVTRTKRQTRRVSRDRPATSWLPLA
jgi:hypothetical protein